MGAFAAAFSAILLRHAQKQISRILWSAGLALTAAASFAAGFYHGFKGVWPNDLIVGLDVATVLAMVGVSLCVLMGTARAMAGKRAHDALTIFALAKAAAFALWTPFHRDFVYVIADYALSLLVVLALSAMNRRQSSARWLMAGVGVSAVGALVQTSGWNAAWFLNHNDLYHLIQIFSLYAFYRGSSLLRDRRPSMT